MTRGVGDPEALKAQLEEHHEAGYGWALCCCGGNPLEAEEALQAAYLKVLEGKARYRGESAFRTWLFAIIRRTASDHRRRAVLQRLRLMGNGSRVVPVGQPADPDDSVHRSQVQRRFREALRVLPRRQRDVLQLVFYHDLTLQESATVMGVSVGSARRHYDRGKQRLRVLLADMEEVNAT